MTLTWAPTPPARVDDALKVIVSGPTPDVAGVVVVVEVVGVVGVVVVVVVGVVVAVEVVVVVGVVGVGDGNIDVGNINSAVPLQYILPVPRRSPGPPVAW